MFKYFIVIAVLGQLSQAQRPFYAGRESRFPMVLGKYTSTTTESSADNRIGESNSNGIASAPDSQIQTESDYDRFVQRVSSWPADKQPFWYKNRDAIWAMVNQNVDRRNPPQSGAASNNNSRPPFAGQG